MKKDNPPGTAPYFIRVVNGKQLAALRRSITNVRFFFISSPAAAAIRFHPGHTQTSLSFFLLHSTTYLSRSLRSVRDDWPHRSLREQSRNTPVFRRRLWLKKEPYGTTNPPEIWNRIAFLYNHSSATNLDNIGTNRRVGCKLFSFMPRFFIASGGILNFYGLYEKLRAK